MIIGIFWNIKDKGSLFSGLVVVLVPDQPQERIMTFLVLLLMSSKCSRQCCSLHYLADQSDIRIIWRIISSESFYGWRGKRGSSSAQQAQGNNEDFCLLTRWGYYLVCLIQVWSNFLLFTADPLCSENFIQMGLMVILEVIIFLIVCLFRRTSSIWALLT